MRLIPMKMENPINYFTLFVDMDGVLADFDKHFPLMFGVSHVGMPKKEMWKYIKSEPDFFSTIPPFPGVLPFFFSIEHLNPIILTACPSSDYANVATQKRRWIREILGEHVPVLPVCGSESKPLFMHREGDVLIDDWGKNCLAWEAAGGVAIKHENFKSTTQQLFEVLSEYE